MDSISHILRFSSARSIGAAIFAKKFSSVDATKWYLQRIEQYGGQTQLNCVRCVSPLAIEQAQLADDELARGLSRGPLHGVPYLLKDNIFTVDGCSTSAGAAVLSNFRPSYEATLVQRLRQAGAVLLGKTNLTEFADFVSDVMPSEFSGAGGVVRNPLGFSYSRGHGSSVGSAAAVAARLCAFAIGTETQNSIQAPAVHSSLVGFKPTVGRVSRHGVVPLVPSQDSPGVLATNVDDAALVFHAMAGPDVSDSATLAHLNNRPVRSALLAGMRIGVPRRFVAEAALTSSRVNAFDATLEGLRAMGAVVVDPCDLPSAEQLHDVRSSVFRTEFKEAINAMLESVRPEDVRSLADIIRWNAAHPSFIPYGQSLLEAANQTDGVVSARYILDRRKDLALSHEGGIVAALTAGDVDVLIAPMTAAAKCTGKAGAPVAAIPVGTDNEGMPFGITVFASRGSDELVLEAAIGIEQAVATRVESSF